MVLDYKGMDRININTCEKMPFSCMKSGAPPNPWQTSLPSPPAHIHWPSMEFGDSRAPVDP